MIFPVLRFWEDTPLAWLAKLPWNCSELLRLPCPFAPHVLGAIIGARPRREG